MGWPDLGGVGPLEELEGHLLQAALQAVEDIEGPLAAEGLLQQVLG